jgi:glutamate N-acetyltransferase/amino-acid N-acetyltransferase
MSFRCSGFRFGAAAAGIKSTGAVDVGVIVSDQPATAAALFTRNRVKAAPVKVSRAALTRSGGVAQAVVVNSGNANACTGAAGAADARRMLAVTGAALAIPTPHVLVASTGVIGQRLPMARVEQGIHAACAGLAADGFAAFAHAILTTDRRAKLARRRVTLGGRRITLLGCTKGAGMIAPNMATTLTFVVTDAPLLASAARAALVAAAASTFNAIIVDGDTSTNDMLLLLGHRPGIAPALGRAHIGPFTAALTDLLAELCRALVRDGEGVHHVVTVHVRGARSEADARRVARAIAVSPLCKTAIGGRDPNWGRFLCAAGNAGAVFDPDRADLWLDRVPIVKGGVGALDARGDARARQVMAQPTYTLCLDLHAGRAEARALACDLSHEYVTINADYRT